MYTTSEVSVPFKLLFSLSSVKSKWIGYKVLSLKKLIYIYTISGLVFMIHWCILRFPTFIPAQELTWVKNVTSFVLEVTNIIYCAGTPLSRYNGIGLGWILDGHLNIPAEIANNGDLSELSYLIYPSFLCFCSGVLLVCLFPYWFISLLLSLFCGW